MNANEGTGRDSHGPYSHQHSDSLTLAIWITLVLLTDPSGEFLCVNERIEEGFFAINKDANMKFVRSKLDSS